MQEPVAADAYDRLAEGQPFEVLEDEGPQDVLRGEVAFPPLAAALREVLEVFVDRIQNLRILVEHLTDRPVSGTIV